MRLKITVHPNQYYQVSIPNYGGGEVVTLDEVREIETQRDGLVAALGGVSIMLNTALKDYESEPWAQRVRTALAKARGEQP